MSAYAPQWALSAQAIDSVGDPHLSKGVHLRLMPAAVMGLPIFPFKVYRVNLGQSTTSGLFRTDGIRWVDSKNIELTTPFTLSPDNPVTAFLPSSGICCWIEIDAEAPAGAIRTDAQVPSYHGMMTVSSATAPKHQMAASRIDRVVIKGSGRVAGARWLDAKLLDRYANDPWRLLSLSAAPDHYYTPTATAVSDAIDRVRRGGPLREPMYNAPNATGPVTSPAIALPPDAEKLRVENSNASAKSWVNALIAKGTQPPPQRRFSYQTNTTVAGSFEMSMLEAVWLSSLDPGMAKWLGFGDVDDQPVGVTGDVVAYIIKGIWQQDIGALNDPDLHASIAAGRLDTVAALNTAKGFALANPAGVKPPFYDLFTVACATIGKPGVPPSAPLLDKFDYKPFLPAIPPEARREVVLRAKGFVPGPGVAFAREASAGFVSLNPKNTKGAPLPLIVSTPHDSSEGNGKLYDRNAPPKQIIYRLAQADWFGRWSPWGQYTADPANRPKPPRPVIQAFYAPPEEVLWSQPGPLSGKFTVIVPVPPNESLAPGSYPLATLQLKVGNVTASKGVATANANGDIVAEVTGPALMPCAQTEVTITAKWIDSDNQFSDESLPVVRKISDPRPPEPVELNYALDYSSRPDATGKSRIDLRWNASGNQDRFRVYYASETILLSKLEKVNAGLANQIRNAASMPQRAQMFKDNKNAFSRAWFEVLTNEPLKKGGASTMRFVHEVSGKLATLGFYRVAPVSIANIEGSFDSTPMVAYAVPNVMPPAMPLLNVIPVPANSSANVTIRVPRGVTAAAAYRLRRTTGTPSDAARIRVVAEGAINPAAPGDPMQEVVVPQANLKLWKRYFWRAEVRGVNLPGANIKGDWSKASAPVETILIPSGPPLPVSNLTLTAAPGKWTISFHHDPAQLNGGSVGRFRLELYKHIPGLKEQKIATLFAGTPAGDTGFDAQGDASFVDAADAPPGTAYRVLVIDPLERISMNNETKKVPGGN